jgi:glycosyltransferase involved in cell wall biosynthesis
MPVFNGERFIGEALESVFAQDHRPIEVIVVDDGSTDGSAAVVRDFGEVILVRQENRGAAAARNVALARATGSLITFLDADDQMAAGRLSTQVEHLRTHPDVGGVLMSQELVLEPGVAIPEWVRPFGAPDDVVGGLMITAMVRREAAELVGGFDPSYRVCHDADWLFRLREAGVRIDVLTEVGVLRRIHRTNLSHQIDVIRVELARALRERLERARVRGGGGGA